MKGIVLLSLLFFSCASLLDAVETTPEIKESDAEMEEKIIREAEEQKEAQLKEYFRDYYYKQGTDYFKKARYEEAIAKFTRALHWDPEYESAIRYVKLSEDKISERQRLQKEKKLAEERRKEAQEKKKRIIEAKKESQEKISPEKSERLTAQEVSLAEAPPREVLYRIDIEDVLEISVWRHPELSKEIIVRPDGWLSFPLVGEIQASGLTLPELKEKITQGLSEFARKKLKPSVSEKEEERAGYLIGLGDTLDISVWKVADLSREVIVRPDGMISFPLVGDLKASSLTLVQLDEEITKALSNYVKEPQVSIMVTSFGWKKEIPAEVFLEESPEVTATIKKFGGKKVIVLGEVIKPGVYTFTSDIRLMEALALAGSFTKYAVKNNVFIIRGDIRKNPSVISSNILAFLKEARLGENILIQPQDVIFVPRTLVGNINAFLESIAPIVDTVYKGAITQVAVSGS